MNGDVTIEILKDIRNELRTGLGELRTELRTGLGDLRTELHETRDDLKAEIAATNLGLARLERRQSESEIRISTELTAVGQTLFQIRDLLADRLGLRR